MSRTPELRLSNLGQLELLRAFAERGAQLRTHVTGSSMRPFIRDGDVVTLAPLDGGVPRVGEVVAAVLPDPERLVVHRVVARRGDGWTIRGDACPRPDGVVGSADVLGRVVRVERGGRVVSRGATSAAALGATVAALSRRGVPAAAVRLGGRPRRAVAAALRAVQSLRAYRSVARWLGTRLTAVDAGDDHGPPRAPSELPPVTDLVAHWGGLRVGAAQLVVTRDPTSPWAGHWLLSLTVRAALRGMGVGEALARAAIERAREDGAEEVCLAVQEGNARAIALYRKLGFAHTVRPSLEPTLVEEGPRLGRRRVVMRLTLAERP